MRIIKSRLKIALGIFVVLALLILCAWSPWDSLRFHGDGVFSDELFFYPRYWVRFTDIPLNEVGEHHFRFRGIPNEEMSLVLYVKNNEVRAEAEEVRLRNLPVTIEASWTDEKGNVVCHATGRPDPGNRDGVWVLMSGGGEAGYWHYGCNPVQVYPNKTYDLMIRVSDVGPDIEKVVVTPILSGGGIELP